jgi:hypothetical protein
MLPWKPKEKDYTYTKAETAIQKKRIERKQQQMK